MYYNKYNIKEGVIVMEDKLLLSLLQKNARMKITDLAAALEETKDNVIDRLTELEKEKVICGVTTNLSLEPSSSSIKTTPLFLYCFNTKNVDVPVKIGRASCRERVFGLV